MSNYLAIATVTATLRNILQAVVGGIVPGATVTTLRPDSFIDGNKASGVNIYLYQVTSNSTYSNLKFPTRNFDGKLIERQRVALNLDYILSFVGDESRLEPQRLLGAVVGYLDSKPILTHNMIQNTIRKAIDDNDSIYKFLKDSDMDKEIELVKFTTLSVNLEELSKLWSVFFRTPYMLSIVYQGSVVLIDSDEMPIERESIKDLRIEVDIKST